VFRFGNNTAPLAPSRIATNSMSLSSGTELASLKMPWRFAGFAHLCRTVSTIHESLFTFQVLNSCLSAWPEDGPALALRQQIRDMYAAMPFFLATEHTSVTHSFRGGVAPPNWSGAREFGGGH
jgi:hypothetical protein